MLTWVSVKLSCWANCFRSAPTTYWLFSKACSSFRSWVGEKAVLTRFGLRKGCNRKSVKKIQTRKHDEWIKISLKSYDFAGHIIVRPYLTCRRVIKYLWAHGRNWLRREGEGEHATSGLCTVCKFAVQRNDNERKNITTRSKKCCSRVTLYRAWIYIIWMLMSVLFDRVGSLKMIISRVHPFWSLARILKKKQLLFYIIAKLWRNIVCMLRADYGGRVRHSLSLSWYQK